MIKMICDKCNKDANFFGTKELTQEEIDKLSIEHSCDFQSRLMIETYTCPSCGDMKDFIHILY